MSDDGAGRTATGRVDRRPSPVPPTTEALPFDPSEPLPRLRRELDTGPDGLSAREAARRLAVHGPNEVRRKASAPVWREAAVQLAPSPGPAAVGRGRPGLRGGPDRARLGRPRGHPRQRGLRAAPGTPGGTRGGDPRLLPARDALVVRDGRPLTVEARDLVPGDVIVLEEGDKVPADGRVTEGGVEVDLSMLTGESVPPRSRNGHQALGPGPGAGRRRVHHGHRDKDGELHGDPTEPALVEGAAGIGAPVDLDWRDGGGRPSPDSTHGSG